MSEKKENSMNSDLTGWAMMFFMMSILNYSFYVKMDYFNLPSKFFKYATITTSLASAGLFAFQHLG